jgi:hypothetical protein
MYRRKSFNVLAGISIFIGALLLLQNYNVIPNINKLWPIFSLFLGWGLGILYFKRGRKDQIALGMGVFLICFSIMAFYYNFTSWVAISGTWPLFLGFAGISFLVVAYFANSHPIVILIGVFLCFLCFVFILVFTVDLRLWPISLVLFGICIFLIRRYG